MKQKENGSFRDTNSPENSEIFKKAAQLPLRCLESLTLIMKYLDTPLLEEIISPDTPLSRLYELFVIWVEEGLYELLTLTALKIEREDGGIKEYKIDEARKNLGLPSLSPSTNCEKE